MLDLKYVVDNIDLVIEKLNTRNDDYSYLKELVALYENRKQLISDVESKKAFRNETSKQVGVYKRENKDVKPLLDEVASIGDLINDLDNELKAIESKIHNILAVTPNIPEDDLPIGDESVNEEVRKHLDIPTFDFEIKDHVTLGENLNILDFNRAAKITGARFVVYKGLGARLERALYQFMMDLHSIEADYVEALPPFIVNEESMFATGQFPKFKDDAFKIEGRDWYLNPTAEVPMINLYRDEIIETNKLPLKYVAYTSAFRSEAGSAGRDTRGILRQHQFQKVELIQFTEEDKSKDALEEMILQAELVLKKLKLPYRVVTLATGDIGFSMKKTYDIEVWIPSQNKYREIGSISNAGEFQARRANIRYRDDKNSKTKYVHTLNGSGLAVGRTIIAIMENYQTKNGQIIIPEVLVPYMNEKIIK